MVAQLYSRDLLLPIDDVIDQIKKEQNDTIYEGVLNLQYYKGSHYGIAYAVGTTAFAYRRYVADKLGLTVPKKLARRCLSSSKGSRLLTGNSNCWLPAAAIRFSLTSSLLSLWLITVKVPLILRGETIPNSPANT